MSKEARMAEVLEIPKRRGKYGEGSIRQLGLKRWQISYYDTQGRRRRESFSTEAKAEKALTRALALRDTGKLEPYEGRVKVDALAELTKPISRIPNRSRTVGLNWFGVFTSNRFSAA